MRRIVLKIFDDMVYGAGPFYSPTGLNKILGQFDKVAVQLVADQSGGTTPTCTVNFEYSNDERNWPQSATLINAQSITAGTTTTAAGTDAGTTPRLGAARARISLGNADNYAHLVITACLRDDS